MLAEGEGKEERIIKFGTLKDCVKNKNTISRAKHVCLPKSWAGNYRNVGVYTTSSQRHPQSGLSSWSHPAECDGNDIFASCNIAKISTPSETNKKDAEIHFIPAPQWHSLRCWSSVLAPFATKNRECFPHFPSVHRMFWHSATEHQLKEEKQLK